MHDLFLAVANEVERVLGERLFLNIGKPSYVRRKKTMKRHYNVVVIGKAGVGKSSLINYLFGGRARRTGSGESGDRERIPPGEV